MKTAILTLVSLILAAAAPGADKPTRNPGDRRGNVPVRRLTVRPAGAPKPALRCRLLPGVLDQTPGNAAQLYYLASEVGGNGTKASVQEKVRKWLATPPADLPRGEVRDLLKGYEAALRQVELAARREYCHWDLPIRSEGFSLIVPPLSKHRALAGLLALRARLAAAEGRTDRAVHDLQTLFAMSRHLGEGPTLIQALVAAAIAELGLDQVEDLIEAPGLPNLYWALTMLPRPFVSLRRSMQFEADGLYLAFPRLRGITKAGLSRAQWQAVTEELARALGMIQGSPGSEAGNWKGKVGLIALGIYAYPRAKKYLLAKGRTLAEIEALPVQQVVALYYLDSYQRLRDEQIKWFYVPYWQAHAGLERAADRIRIAARRDPGNIFMVLLPALSRAYFATTKIDRRIAALRCIEAVRMYAARHGGRLPASLQDVKDVPIPPDPVTGKPFDARIVGRSMRLFAPAPKGSRPRDGFVYEVEFRND